MGGKRNGSHAGDGAGQNKTGPASGMRGALQLARRHPLEGASAALFTGPLV